MVYGEIELGAISECFDFIRLNYPESFPEKEVNDKIFIDIGHGVGKGILAGALLYPFKKCIGIEILDSLYQKSEVLKAKYYEMIGQMDKIGKI